VLALSTLCLEPEDDLPRALRAVSELPVDAAALHRPPHPLEIFRLAEAAKRVRIVAIFGGGCDGLPVPVWVIDGGAAGADRERSLEELCRRLHAIRGARVALRTPSDPAREHPSPEEIAVVASEVRHAGYWHDVARGGEAWLDAAGRALFGASFDPLSGADLRGLRDALPAAAPAVLTLAPGAPRPALLEAIRLARGVFR
jgi:hypothetical protein